MIRKTLGQGTTPAEKDIEAVLARVDDWNGAELSYEPVGGGISNANWRVHLAGREISYFVKVPGKGTERFIDRAAAHDASVKAHAAGVGAKVCGFLADSGVEIFEFMDGMRTST
ncbi:MAG: choline/ethanolamine kinase--aminoglycoside phosphotransferase, partial [Kiloniellales bacterium]|nr:choline/ethanolamine kinase--aminoglycoside phosphotransferase [Kiloniellales bacterium]